MPFRERGGANAGEACEDRPMSEKPRYQLADVPSDRHFEFLEIDQWAFAATYKGDVSTQVATMVPWNRARAVTSTDGPDAGAIVAVHGSYEHELTVPGGTVKASGLTWVGVHPAHRRRGLLRMMIADHFERSIARGEAVSGLFAAEPAIYQRFGYGMACWGNLVTLGRGGGLRPVDGADDLRIRLEDSSIETHLSDVRHVVARANRPGTPTRFQQEMIAGAFLDPEQWREGKERQRIAIVEDADGPAAFALFQRQSQWENSIPQGTCAVRAYQAATAAAEHRLVSVVSDLDLMGKTTWPAVPLDSALVALSEDPRGIRPQAKDQLWLRILDVKAALEARSYSADLTLTLRVTDDLVPANAGTWRLEVRGASARCEVAQGATPDLTIDVQQLSAAYLGAQSIAALAAAGLVKEHTQGAAIDAAKAFWWHQAPHSPWIF